MDYSMQYSVIDIHDDSRQIYREKLYILISGTGKKIEDNEEKNERESDDKHKGQDTSTCGRSEDKEQNDRIEIEKNKDEIEEKYNLKDKIVDDVDKTKKEGLKNMVRNMMGVLFTLKYQGDLNMTENNYLTELHTSVYEENPEEFHEINTVLLNICSKQTNKIFLGKLSERKSMNENYQVLGISLYFNTKPVYGYLL